MENNEHAKKNLSRLENLSNLAEIIIDGDVVQNQDKTNFIEQELSFVSTDTKFKETIQPQLDIYNKKFDKSITYESMFENLNALVSLTKLEKTELTAIFGDHIASSAFLIEYKAAITILSYFDKFLNSISSNEQVIAEEFSAGILNSVLNFIPKISKLREQYSVNNLDQMLRNNNSTANNAAWNKDFQAARRQVIDEHKSKKQ